MITFNQYLLTDDVLKRLIHDYNRVSKDLSERRTHRKFAQYDPDNVLLVNMNREIVSLLESIQKLIEENRTWYVIEELYGKEKKEEGQ